ncbi:UTRA domain-containing protein [Micromonospora pisi]|uniref:UTRA domain-containing protein n=1 Tax=Micromonospora pisi TaxID=589240 RepID=A0A495JEM1_9ACTN|nr:UTRA domain-containing protein [Micromonospora pisi]RKR87456.1 UTRA domain-containing protein [Micromonospora pisi]
MSTPRWASTSDPYVIPGVGDAWAKEAAARGRTGSQQLLGVETVVPDLAIRTALDLGDEGRAVVRRRLILEDDQPVELADSYYPAWLAGGTPLAENQKIRGGAIAVLAQLGHTPATVTENITARQPTEAEQTELRIGDHEPLLVMRRLNRNGAGRPVEYVITHTVARLSPGFTYQMQIPVE